MNEEYGLWDVIVYTGGQKIQINTEKACLVRIGYERNLVLLRAATLSIFNKFNSREVNIARTILKIIKKVKKVNVQRN
ncbi:hypothetical protein RE476_06120 [Methanolobus mangrovi]|uniref:Uncharacterized protein n=1 Tax=Methanolobus mangrovi TaxID=3072977 RepID=A0AA51UHR6_9EURY|nr:hypothetical protein [Methanolobus mangrovi]WMW23391.1 hypothetical protein RE476_06120 [Methanolobus mangrovi]